MVPASSPTNWKAMPGKLAHDHKQPQWMHGAIYAQTVAVHNLRCECVYNWRAKPNLQVACSSWEPLEDRGQASNRNDHAEHLAKMISQRCMLHSPAIALVACAFIFVTVWVQHYFCSFIELASCSGNSTVAYICWFPTAKRSQLLSLHPSIWQLLWSPKYKKRSWQKECLRRRMKWFWDACPQTHITGTVIDLRIPAGVQ